MDIFDFQSPEDPDSVMPYFHTTGAYTNAGGHRIPDVVEGMLSNASRFLDFYNFTHDKKNNATGLWDDYAWSIAYYFSIKLHEEWDDVYHNLESNPLYWIEHYNAAEVSNASWVDNATKYIQSQYNPLVVENVAPVILKFSVEFHYYVVTAEFDVHAMVADAGEVEKVKIVDSDFGQSAEWEVDGRVAEINHTFWASPWGANLGANISVKAWDVRENKVVINKTILGPVGQTLELLWSMLPAWLRRALVSAAQRVAQAVNVIVGWVESLFMAIVQKIIDTIESILSGLVLAYGALLSSIASVIYGTRSKNDNALINAIKEFVDEIIKFHWILIGTFTAVLGAMLVIKAATMGIEQIIETALFTAAKSLVISMLVGLLVPGLWESITNLVNKNETGISEIWDFIINYLGITASYGATIVGIIETTVESIKKKSFSWFFAGLTLAVGGFFVDAATTAYHLTDGWLQAADLAGCLLSYFGLIIMIVTSYRDPTETSIEKASPLLAILQWIVAIGGFAKAMIDGIADANSGWG